MKRVQDLYHTCTWLINQRTCSTQRVDSANRDIQDLQHLKASEFLDRETVVNRINNIMAFSEGSFQMCLGHTPSDTKVQFPLDFFARELVLTSVPKS